MNNTQQFDLGAAAGSLSVLYQELSERIERELGALIFI